MYKMLIVDDNPHEWKGISEKIDWISTGIEIVGGCSNGKKALELIDELKPNIILTDIAMPVMDGIEMAKQLRISHPHIKIVFMSCHYEFDYAKSAIDLDIYGYVLKPFVAAELLSAIRKVIKIMDTESTVQQEKAQMIKQLERLTPLLQEQFLRELVFGLSHGEDDISEKLLFLNMGPVKDLTLRVLYLEVMDYETVISGMKVVDKYLISYSITRMLESLSSQNLRTYPLQISSGGFAVLLVHSGYDNSTDTLFIEQLVELKDLIEKTLNIRIAIGVSKTASSFQDAALLYQQSVNSIKARVYSDENRINLYEEIEKIQSIIFEETVNLQELFKEVKDIITLDNADTIKAFIDKYLTCNIASQSESYVKSFSFAVVNHLHIALLQMDESLDAVFNGSIAVWSKLSRFDSIKDIRQWIYNILLMTREYLCSKSAAGHGQIIKKIKDIIHEKYNENLTLTYIANAINFSPCHASNTFKSVTGKTIFDYVMEYRMERAKELLKDPYSKIYLVSEQVGYTNKSHFSMQFKKYTGLTPMEYKNSIIS